MADLSITAANVLAASGTRITWGTAGATLTAGKAVYMDAADSNKLKACRSNTATRAACVGIALADAASGQPIPYAAADGTNLNVGATLAVGVLYAVSPTGTGNSGHICPVADVVAEGTGNYVSTLGVATNTSNLKLRIENSGVALA